MKFEQTKTEKNTATLVFTATTAEIDQATTTALKHMGEDITIKGFRKGKAPTQLLKDQLDPTKVRQHTINHLLQDHLGKAVKKFKLALIGNPQLVKIEDPTGKAWTLTLEMPLMPQIKLPDYTKLISTFFKTKKAKELNQNQKVDQTCRLLIDKTTLDVPQTLIDSEVQKSLSRLVEQTQNLGLSVEKYLESVGKTIKQIRDEYQKSATDNLKLDFILLAIAKQEKIKVSDQEVESLINASGDEAAKKHLRSEGQKPYLQSIIAKRKVIDSLLKLC